MNRPRTILRLTAILIILLAGFITLLEAGRYEAAPSAGISWVVIEILIGFAFFLTHNLSAISFDSGTWGPGIAAYLTAMALSHRFLSTWARQSGRPWSLASTFCVFLILPVMFGISFLVPGVLLQWELLHQGPWIQSR